MFFFMYFLEVEGKDWGNYFNKFCFLVFGVVVLMNLF